MKKVADEVEAVVGDSRKIEIHSPSAQGWVKESQSHKQKAVYKIGADTASRLSAWVSQTENFFSEVDPCILEPSNSLKA